MKLRQTPPGRRAGRSSFLTLLKGVLQVDAHGVLVDQLAAEKAGQGDQPGGQQRQPEPPGRMALGS